MIIRSATFVGGFASLKQLPTGDHPEVAFAGRSNVGKSSLINMVLGRRSLARTSGQPGKTRELNYYLVNEAFHLVDLPGFGYAKTARTQRERWVRLITSFLDSRLQLRLLVHVIDGRHAPTDIDHALMEQMHGLPFPYVVVLSKSDKLSGNTRTESLRRAQAALAEHHLEVPVIPASAQTRRGREDLLHWIETAIG